jgi:biopolymer transport protein ExbB
MIASLFRYGGWIVWLLFALSVVALAIIIAKTLIFATYRRRLRQLAADFGGAGPGETRDRILNQEALRLAWGLTTLRVVGSAAPLLGLLGTVIGLFDAFQAVAVAGLGDPSAFADSVAFALTTTIAGLLVAVPCIAAHQYLVASVERLLLKMESALEVAGLTTPAPQKRRVGT